MSEGKVEVPVEKKKGSRIRQGELSTEVRRVSGFSELDLSQIAVVAQDAQTAQKKEAVPVVSQTPDPIAVLQVITDKRRSTDLSASGKLASPSARRQSISLGDELLRTSVERNLPRPISATDSTTPSPEILGTISGHSSNEVSPRTDSPRTDSPRKESPRTTASKTNSPRDIARSQDPSSSRYFSTRKPNPASEASFAKFNNRRHNSAGGSELDYQAHLSKQVKMIETHLQSCKEPMNSLVSLWNLVNGTEEQKSSLKDIYRLIGTVESYFIRSQMYEPFTEAATPMLKKVAHFFRLKQFFHQWSTVTIHTESWFKKFVMRWELRKGKDKFRNEDFREFLIEENLKKSSLIEDDQFLDLQNSLAEVLIDELLSSTLIPHISGNGKREQTEKTITVRQLLTNDALVSGYEACLEELSTEVKKIILSNIHLNEASQRAHDAVNYQTDLSLQVLHRLIDHMNLPFIQQQLFIDLFSKDSNKRIHHYLWLSELIIQLKSVRLVPPETDRSLEIDVCWRQVLDAWTKCVIVPTLATSTKDFDSTETLIKEPLTIARCITESDLLRVLALNAYFIPGITKTVIRNVLEECMADFLTRFRLFLQHPDFIKGEHDTNLPYSDVRAYIFDFLERVLAHISGHSKAVVHVLDHSSDVIISGWSKLKALIVNINSHGNTMIDINDERFAKMEDEIRKLQGFRLDYLFRNIHQSPLDIEKLIQTAGRKNLADKRRNKEQPSSDSKQSGSAADRSDWEIYEEEIWGLFENINMLSTVVLMENDSAITFIRGMFKSQPQGVLSDLSNVATNKQCLILRQIGDQCISVFDLGHGVASKLSYLFQKQVSNTNPCELFKSHCAIADEVNSSKEIKAVLPRGSRGLDEGSRSRTGSGDSGSRGRTASGDGGTRERRGSVDSRSRTDSGGVNIEAAARAVAAGDRRSGRLSGSEIGAVASFEHSGSRVSGPDKQEKKMQQSVPSNAGLDMADLTKRLVRSKSSQGLLSPRAQEETAESTTQNSLGRKDGARLLHKSRGSAEDPPNVAKGVVRMRAGGNKDRNASGKGTGAGVLRKSGKPADDVASPEDFKLN